MLERPRSPPGGKRVAHVFQPLAVQRVAAERHLGQLDRHRVLVDAVDHPLEDDAADDVAVVEVLLVEPPVVGLGVVEDLGADRVDAAGERRVVRLVLGHPAHLQLGGGHGFEHLVGQVVHQRHQEVAAAHRRVAHLEVEDAGGGVGAGQLVQALRLRPLLSDRRGSSVHS